MPRTVLAVFAHPDDETFGPGGTLAALAAAGDRVELLCATRGEAGTIGESASFGPRRLADIRTGELAEAVRVLGIQPPVVMDLPDGGLADLAPRALLEPIVQLIRGRRPELLVTFHPDGLSGHDDHKTVTTRLLEAFDLAADEGYEPGLGAPHRASRIWVYSIPRSKASRVTYRKLYDVPDEELDAVIDVRPFVTAKRAAVTAHATQKPFIDKLEAFLGDLEGFWSEEAFVLAKGAPLPANASRPVNDLYLGL